MKFEPPIFKSRLYVILTRFLMRFERDYNAILTRVFKKKEKKEERK